MKRRAKAIAWGCVGILVFLLGICFLTNLTDPKLSYARNKEFIENGEGYDVLFLGNSHMANGVYPMELWHERGITSYNLAGFGYPIPSTYWVMENALDTASPELIVIDCNNVRSEGKPARREMLHGQVDYLPLSLNKVRMICDVVEEPEDRLEFLWDFTVYHDRWWDLDQADFEPVINVQKGAEIAFDVVAPAEMSKKPEGSVDIESVGAAYLRRIIEECQSRNIDILLTYLPFPASEEEWQEALYVEQLAQEYGVSYINFLDLEVVDLEVDCSDKDSHLNGSGGRKVTSYIGRYIEAHYEIADHRAEEDYAGWNDDYRRYTEYKLGIMENLESLDKYLMMCADPAFDYSIYVNGKDNIWKQNRLYLPLLDNISSGRVKCLEQAAASESDYLMIVKKEETGGCQEFQGEEARMMAMHYFPEMTEDDSAAVQILVMDGEDGRVLHEKRFDNKIAIYSE